MLGLCQRKHPDCSESKEGILNRLVPFCSVSIEKATKYPSSVLRVVTKVVPPMFKVTLSSAVGGIPGSVEPVSDRFFSFSDKKSRLDTNPDNLSSSAESIFFYV